MQQLVKGVTRRVVVIKSPDPKIFEEAIFIVKEDARTVGVTGDEIIRQARETADMYVRNNLKKKALSRIPAPVFALLGAAATGCVWLATTFI